MKRKVGKYCLAALLAIPLLAAVGWGMPGKGHFALWNEVFGVADSESRKNIEPLWEAAQKVIDSMKFDGVSSDYQKLKAQFKWFNWGKYGHRLLFHWGFNGDPRRHPPMVKQVGKRLKKAEEEARKKGKSMDVEELKEEFYKYLLREIQGPRNKRLIQEVRQTLGIPTARGYANAVATIIHDVHLLGDYTTELTDPLPGLDAIQQDLVKHGFKRLLRGEGNTERLQRIEEDLKAAIRLGRGRTNPRRAKLLLEATTRCLPQILNERFQDTLRARNITLTSSPPDESQK